MRPDLTYGKGTGQSPAGINREGSFVRRARFLEYPCPSAEVKSLVKISPCPHVSLSDIGDPSRSYLNFRQGEERMCLAPDISSSAGVTVGPHWAGG